jgi:hypothetical protein
VLAGCFDIRKLDTFVLKPCLKLAIGSDQLVFGSTCNPEQPQVLIRIRVNAGKLRIEITEIDTSCTEGANSGKFVQMIQSYEQ